MSAEPPRLPLSPVESRREAEKLRLLESRQENLDSLLRLVSGLFDAMRFTAADHGLDANTVARLYAHEAAVKQELAGALHRRRPKLTLVVS